ncbi:hypothetical protein [Enterobacter phage 03_vB_Eclo_IJM]|nr:hypothetical protein [Enterobacter phage 03_vB_Eclo_IJM]
MTSRELSDVTDWSLLEVTMPDGVSYSRRTNSLYFKATSGVEGLVTVRYDGLLCVPSTYLSQTN